MKLLYVCSVCKKMGIKSDRARMFEEFFCPNCHKNTTLFLPSVKVEKPEVEKPKVEVNYISPPPLPIPSAVSVTKTESRGLTTIKPVIIFIIGFITALLVMK